LFRQHGIVGGHGRRQHCPQLGIVCLHAGTVGLLERMALPHRGRVHQHQALQALRMAACKLRGQQAAIGMTHQHNAATGCERIDHGREVGQMRIDALGVTLAAGLAESCTGVGDAVVVAPCPKPDSKTTVIGPAPVSSACSV